MSTYNIATRNIPAQIVVNGHSFDVVIEEATVNEEVYDYGGDSYFDRDLRKMVYGEEIITETFVCKRIFKKKY